jgi:hypothetical protein
MTAAVLSEAFQTGKAAVGTGWYSRQNTRACFSDHVWPDSQKRS